ncbi:MAG TPA: hypothetical protein VH165_22845 [Kofleriaceae bacterium]|jgi:hypothetical protein|nr:hypothetical protein [Kofleriaceae bacterium]
MRTTFSNDKFAILDDVLSSDQLAGFWRHLNETEYNPVNRTVFKGQWKEADGTPVESKLSIVASNLPIQNMLPPALAQAAAQIATFYPTRSPLDAVIDATRQCAQQFPDLVGKEQADWLGLTARLYKYPVNTSLSWHMDERLYTGAFIYYGHPVWDLKWGGELLIADAFDRKALAKPTDPAAAEDGRPRDEVLMSEGLGHYVSPKPNRMVLLAPEVPHMITKVHPDAGERFRASIAGFFVSPFGLQRIAEQLASIPRSGATA